MTNLPFILAAYGVILGALTVYAIMLARRLARARAAARDDDLPGGPEVNRAE